MIPKNLIVTDYIKLLSQNMIEKDMIEKDMIVLTLIPKEYIKLPIPIMMKMVLIKKKYTILRKLFRIPTDLINFDTIEKDIIKKDDILKDFLV